MEDYNYLSDKNTWCLQGLLYKIRKKTQYLNMWNYATTRLKSENVLHVYNPRQIEGTLTFCVLRA